MISRSKCLLPILGMIISMFGISLSFASRDNLHMIITFIGITMLLASVAELISLYRANKQQFKSFTLISWLIPALLGLRIIFSDTAEFSEFIMPILLAIWVFSISAPRISFVLSKKCEGSLLWIFAVVFIGIVVALVGMMLLYPNTAVSITIYSFSLMFILYGVSIISTPFKLIERTGNINIVK